MKRYESIIVDADVCIHLSSLKSDRYLYKILSSISDKVLIHNYVYNEEITGNKTQLASLIAENHIQIVDPQRILSPIDYRLYCASVESIYKHHCGYDWIEGIRQEHKGEVCSLGLAMFARIPYFASFDKGIKATNSVLRGQSLTGQQVEVLNLDDIILWIRDDFKEIKRKEAKTIYSVGFDDSQNRIEKFDHSLWPIST